MDAAECERLSQRLYALTAEWEPTAARHDELRRDFIDDGGPSSVAEREERMSELLALDRKLHELERALNWIDRRRTLVMERLERLDRRRRG